MQDSTINRSNVLSALALGVFLVAGCATDRAATSGTEESSGDEYGHFRPRMVDMSDVMQAKLVHAQAIVEGLALNDLRQVATNADALHALSERGSWMVHETVTYVALSDDFRAITRRMSQHARNSELDAVIDAYRSMTDSCIACHSYLRRERLHQDLPGAVSWLDALQRN